MLELQELNSLKQAMAERLSGRARLERLENLAHLGLWEVDLRTGEQVRSKGCYRICGRSPETFAATQENALLILHPDDRDRLQSARSRAWSRTRCTAPSASCTSVPARSSATVTVDHPGAAGAQLK